MTTSLLFVHAKPHDNAVAFAASAGSVPATPAGSWDSAELGAANGTKRPSQWQCRSSQVFPGGRCGATATEGFQGGRGRAVAVSVVAYSAAAQSGQRAWPAAAAAAR